MLGQVASLLVTDEALVIVHVFGSVSGGEIDSVDVHSIGPWQVEWLLLVELVDIAVPTASELPELYHVIVELSCLSSHCSHFQPVFSCPSGRAAAVIMTASWLVTPHWRASTRMLSRSIPLCAWASLKAVAYSLKLLLNWSMLKE